MTAIETREVVDAYHQAWTTKRFDEAVALLAPTLTVEVPINTYPTTESFAAALVHFGDAVVAVEILSEFADGDEAILLYDMDVNGIGAIRVAEHFTVAGAQIVRIRQVHDTAAFRGRSRPNRSRTRSKRRLRSSLRRRLHQRTVDRCASRTASSMRSHLSTGSSAGGHPQQRAPARPDGRSNSHSPVLTKRSPCTSTQPTHHQRCNGPVSRTPAFPTGMARPSPSRSPKPPTTPRCSHSATLGSFPPSTASTIPPRDGTTS